jgi:hypothetical protein
MRLGIKCLDAGAFGVWLHLIFLPIIPRFAKRGCGTSQGVAGFVRSLCKKSE